MKKFFLNFKENSATLQVKNSQNPQGLPKTRSADDGQKLSLHEDLY
jgi:hypothetical protein